MRRSAVCMCAYCCCVVGKLPPYGASNCSSCWSLTPMVRNNIQLRPSVFMFHWACVCALMTVVSKRVRRSLILSPWRRWKVMMLVSATNRVSSTIGA